MSGNMDGQQRTTTELRSPTSSANQTAPFLYNDAQRTNQKILNGRVELRKVNLNHSAEGRALLAACPSMSPEVLIPAGFNPPTWNSKRPPGQATSNPTSIPQYTSRGAAIPTQQRDSGRQDDTGTQKVSPSNGYRNRIGRSSSLSSHANSFQQRLIANVQNSEGIAGGTTNAKSQQFYVGNAQALQPPAPSPRVTGSGSLKVPPIPITHTHVTERGQMQLNSVPKQRNTGQRQFQTLRTAPSASSSFRQEQQTVPRIATPAIGVKYHTHDTSHQSQFSPSQTSKGQKRHATESPQDDVQAPKRQAIKGSKENSRISKYERRVAKIQPHPSKKQQNVSSQTTKPQALVQSDQQPCRDHLLEQQRLAEATRLRRSKRKRELLEDQFVLYHNYNEFLQYFPLQKGEYRNQYLSRLLANQRLPEDKDGDLALAVKYAKEHWQYYLEYPRDVAKTAADVRASEEYQKEKEQKEKLERTKGGRSKVKH